MDKSQFIFTRYLYAKDEVSLALLVSILNKSDDALFWAYELYYSGFTQELFQILQKIYYDFFATLNPAFEAYLLKKEKDWFKLHLKPNSHEEYHNIIGMIVRSLLFRPFNTDVFLLRVSNSLFEYDMNYALNTEKITTLDEFRTNMSYWMETNDYSSMAQWILSINKDAIDNLTIYNCCVELFKLTKVKLGKGIFRGENKNVILLAKIMCLFSEKHHLKKSRSVYMPVESEDIIPYETLCGTNELRSYRILEKACICGIDDLKHLSLFKLKRAKYNLREKYLSNWLYYASFSPLWLQRIQEFGGVIDTVKQSVLFVDDDLMEQFYELYGLEPDEQKSCVQQKSIVDIEKTHNWSWFYGKYRKNGLFEIGEEELEEMDVEGILY